MMNERLLTLIEEKSFEELVKEEKNFVLSHLSKEGYEAQRELILNAHKAMQSEAKQLKVDADKRVQLLSVLQTKQMNQKQEGVKTVEETENGKNTLAGFFTVKIPLWTAAAAVVLIFLLVIPLDWGSENQQASNKVALAATDTVYVDQVIRDTIEMLIVADTVIKEVEVVKNDAKNKIEEAETNQSSSLANNPVDFYRELEQAEMNRSGLNAEFEAAQTRNTLDFPSNTFGKSLKEDVVGRSMLYSSH